MAPTQDMVLGCYYLTIERGADPGQADACDRFSDEQEALLAYDVGRIDTRARRRQHRAPRRASAWSCTRRSRSRSSPGTRRRARSSIAPIRTTVGRVLFNQVLPERLRFVNKTDEPRRACASWSPTATGCSARPRRRTSSTASRAIGFHYATRGGMTIAVDDITVPTPEAGAARGGRRSRSRRIDQQFQRGLITEDERYEQVVDVWKDTTQARSATR